MKRFKLVCTDWNEAHVRFRVFDPAGATVGTLTLLTGDVLGFVSETWNGDVLWNGKCPLAFESEKGEP
jgi:hypothetical protein